MANPPQLSTWFVDVPGVFSNLPCSQLSFPSTDEQIDLEKQRLYPGTDIQVYSPGGGHISKNSSRRGSGNNNSDKNSLSGHISNYSQSRRGSNRSNRSSDSKSSNLERRTSLQRNGAIVTSGNN